VRGFTVVGKVNKGMEVVRKIQQLKDSLQFLEQAVRIIGINRVKNS
jgi:hypothetical protein